MTTPHPPQTTLSFALAYLRAGYSILPISTEGTKGPAGDCIPKIYDQATGRHKATWKPYQALAPDESVVVGWYARRPTPGIAVIAGAVSGNAEVIDFDLADLFAHWCRLADEALPGILARLCQVKTPEGYHIWLRCPGAVIPGNTKLAFEPGRKPKETLIETRGEGGYAIMPGSPPACHPSGGVYEHLAGPQLWDLQPVTPEERDDLLACARYFDRRPVEAEPDGSRGRTGQRLPSADRPADDVRPGDDFDRRGPDWEEILTPFGWRLHSGQGTERTWTRPGKKTGVSASTGHCRGKDGAELLRVFSSNAAPFESERAYGKFRAYALLNHGGDLSAAARDLAGRGYGAAPRKRASSSRSSAAASGDPASPADSAEPASPPTGGAGGATPYERPIITITPDEHAVVEAAVAALAADTSLPEIQRIYRRGGYLVRVLRDPVDDVASLQRATSSPVINLVPRPNLQERLSRAIRWEKIVPRPDGEFSRQHAHPPAFAVLQIHDRGDWPGLRPLHGIVETPVLRPDGTILDRPGYDQATGLVYDPADDFGNIDPSPSQDQATRAADRLLELVAEVPFTNPTAHRAAWLAALLTPFARPAIRGCCPLFMVDGSMAAAGKSMLCDLISIIATGREMARSVHPETNEEMKKLLTSVIMGGDRFLMFDNIGEKSGLGCAALDNALTAPFWSDRILNKSETTRDLRINTLFFATGNNIFLHGDMHRRILPCRLQPLTDTPEAQKYRIEDINAYTLARRRECVRDALTILRAYAAAGHPSQALPPWSSYASWSHIIRNAVFYATSFDPAEAREDVRAADRGADELHALLSAWEAVPECAAGVTIMRLLVLAEALDSEIAPLKSILHAMSKDKRTLPSASVVGNRLRSARGKFLHGRCLDTRKASGNVKEWYIRTNQNN